MAPPPSAGDLHKQWDLCELPEDHSSRWCRPAWPQHHRNSRVLSSQGDTATFENIPGQKAVAGDSFRHEVMPSSSRETQELPRAEKFLGKFFLSGKEKSLFVSVKEKQGSTEPSSVGLLFSHTLLTNRAGPKV